MEVQASYAADSSSTLYELCREGLYTCIKWFCKGNYQNLLFVFVGLEGSGKTTAIRNLFGEPVTSTSETGNPNEIAAVKIVSSDEKNTILDVHSIYSAKKLNENAKILSNLQEYLKVISYVPTIVFVTARLSESRFEGESSEFRMALKSLYVIRHQLTDKSCSNIILLLTHADRPDIQATLKERIGIYKREFASVFSVEPVCLLVSDAPVSKEKIDKLELQGEKLSVFHGLFLDFMNSLYESRPEISTPQAPMVLPGYKVSAKKLQFYGNSNQKILEALKSLNVETKPSSKNESSVSFITKPVAISDKYLQARSFGSYRIFSYLKNIQADDVVYNLVPAIARILLPDKSTVAVKRCMVGQKVFGFNSQVSVVTNVFPVFGNAFGSRGKFLCGRVYMTASNLQTDLASEMKCIMYKNGTISQVPVDKVPRVETGYTNVRYFYIEVNGGNDPFVVDDYVCFSTGPKNVELEFDHPSETEFPSVNDMKETSVDV